MVEIRAAEESNATPLSNKPIRALVVDDSLVARRSIGSLLELDDSVQVIGSAENGILALEQVKTLRPHLVLMDMQMPGMDGLDAAAQLRILDPKVKVIIVTIHDGPELREKCRTMGAHGFVSKNRMHVDLPAEIRRLFGEQTEH